MAPPFAEQPVFVLLDEAGGEICKSDGTVADEAEKAVHCTGIYTGCTVSSGLFCPLYQGSGKIINLTLDDLNKKTSAAIAIATFPSIEGNNIEQVSEYILNTYKTTLSMK